MQAKVAQLQALRTEVMERLITAREMGDLSENGAYKYAKFELGNIGRQLRKYEGLLQAGYPHERSSAAEHTIAFGSVVTLQKLGSTNQNKTFTIVSKHESNPIAGFIAFSSPLGTALMGKQQGETVEVTTPRGDVSYIIIAVN